MWATLRISYCKSKIKFLMVAHICGAEGGANVGL
jgi:hypothetical protein